MADTFPCWLVGLVAFLGKLAGFLVRVNVPSYENMNESSPCFQTVLSPSAFLRTLSGKRVAICNGVVLRAFKVS